MTETARIRDLDGNYLTVATGSEAEISSDDITDATEAGKNVLTAADAAAQRTALGVDTIAIPFIIDGGGAAISAGSKGFLTVPFACTITGWRIVADQSGSIAVTVKRSTYSNFPTTAAISGTEKPTLSSAQKNEDTNLTTWTTAIAAGDVLEFSADATPATVQRVLVSLTAIRA